MIDFSGIDFGAWVVICMAIYGAWSIFKIIYGFACLAYRERRRREVHAILKILIYMGLHETAAFRSAKYRKWIIGSKVTQWK